MIEASRLHFTEKQASAILDLRLHRLIGLEILALKEEYEEIMEKIREYEDILENPSSMKKVIRKELDAFKKEFGRERRTVIENGKEAVYIEAPVKEEQIYFIMDRFGYSKTFDKATYERNKANVYQDYKYVVPCMNTDKICIFTNQGFMHQIKALDIPAGKYRDKGTPIDNLGNYDSGKEAIIEVMAAETVHSSKLLFVTANGMLKVMDGQELKAMKRTVASTKLASDDELVRIIPVDTSQEDKIILQTKSGMFLKFLLEEVPCKKKGAVGVKGIKLGKNDVVSNAYVMEAQQITGIMYKEKKLEFNKLKLAKRDTKGSKIRR